ncbi:CGNR zinc finger domain-containing protein [Amycolatopsis nigrescens]|uniref:CGNR zinc finger domain-containing protein n=1 Tax=Amycolatopsis nigrescens TaxID=381445 RepID=UPI0003626AC2|nr:CGNR zinc finger domain-containing protein [Amycolatopsis nigrescens]
MSEEPAEHPDVSLVLGFLNTLDVDEGTDLLADPGSWQRWARDHALGPGSLTAARSAREGLRAAIGDPAARPGSPRTAVQVGLVGGEPTLVATNAVGAVLAAATRLAVRGEWARMKICPADDCRWAFYDHSRNRSRTWCSMRVCGNREKARAWRERAVNQDVTQSS